ncbi:hypothetical protein WA026_012006 [Henosepilachna vigintioctopunctata]|uniref:Peptidase metallopeptidase domain-containing protein n=1 Tax=Henosepilachna vigintioctopunctata TaxID=420089 RepID=A0AAW1VCX8_9CUCU
MFLTRRLLTVIMAFFQMVQCLPVKSNSGPPTIKVLDFMQQYGYLKKDRNTSAALYTEEGLSDALKVVQRFGAIEETGKLDNATLKLMASPRCGNPDIIQGKRTKRFTFGSEGWNKRYITYYIANWSSRLGEERVNRLIAKALKTWGAYGALKISRKQTPDADIIVSFARGAHNDPFPFDGPGYVLAHAYFPNEGSSFSGDIHFDDDEDWVETTPQQELDRGTDFYTVALHELGHSLGLGHSDDPNAVMFPYYRGSDDNSLQLGHDDIMAMYQLYIVRSIKEEPTSEKPQTRKTYTTTHSTPRRETTRTFYTRTPSTSSTTFKERDTKRQTRFTTPIYTYPRTSTTSYQTRSTTNPYTKEYPYTERTTHRSGNGYSTNDVSTETKKESGPRITVTIHKMPDYSHSSNNPSSPTRTTTVAPIPDICQEKFDAIANLRGEIFVFKNQYIWRYQEQNRLMPGYPVCIKQMFPSLPENTKKIDAAYQRPDGNMILFADDHYWVYDGTRFTENSPKFITDYGIPLGIGGIDAIQTWPKNGKTYLYKADRFWKYDEGNKTVDPGYPAHIERWRGVPKDLDGAMTWKDGKTYFFKNDQYWRFDNDWVIVSTDSPRFTKTEWLGCR